MSDNLPAVPEDYNAEARSYDRARDIYASQRSSRPSYTREDPPGTTRIQNVQPGYDSATFPVMRANQVARMGEDEIVNDQGTLWRLQRMIADAKFDLLKQCIAQGAHMVSDIEAHIVVQLEVRTLTDKAGVVLKVPPECEKVDILLPNGDFRFGGY